ncbi:hypothetical protein BDZ89DRAFT_1142768 [Hymenopellis radicata]|nr:hypothetical protein BDZ89DRAFT_1142768 [Hymenopellis radicata]
MSLRKLSISHSDLSPFLINFLEASRVGQVPSLDSFELLYCDMDDATVAALFTNPSMRSLGLDLYQIKHGHTEIALIPLRVFGEAQYFPDSGSAPKLPPQLFSTSLDTLSIPFPALKWFLECIPLLRDSSMRTVVWTHDGLPAEIVANIPPLPAVLWRELDQRICDSPNVRVATVRIDDDPWSWERDIIQCSPNMIKRGMLQWGNSMLNR